MPKPPFILTRYLGKDLTIRWIIGESKNYPIRPISYELLELSLRFARALFPNARRIVCVSQLKLGYNRIEVIADRQQAECLHISEMVSTIPDVLINSDIHHQFWKYLPLRTSRTGFDLVFDHQLLLWRIPTAIANWLQNGGIVSIGDNTMTDDQRHLGIYKARVDRIKPGLALNDALIGFGIGCTSLPLSINDLGLITDEHDSNGWMTYNFAAFQGAKHLIPVRTIPYLSERSSNTRNLIASSDGIYCVNHFNGNSRLYQNHHEEKLKDLIAYIEYLLNY